MELLNQLLGDNDELIRRFVEIFRTQTPVQLAELRQFLIKKDSNNAAIVAHSLKSQCKYFSLDKAVTLCESIEQHPDSQEVMTQYAQLEQELQRAILILPD